MEINKREENGISILNLRGRLDLANGGILKNEVKCAYAY